MNPPDRSLIYRVSRGGHVMGEFDIDRIVDLLDSGEFLWTDLCWCQGMSGWTPLANLRSEVAAAKAFPPVAAMPGPVATGRRTRQSAAGPTVAIQKSAAGFAAWWWVVAGVSLGALIGLLTTHFFPTVVQVDRPVDRVVEKIVEKPVEVVRVVEKRVDVPAALNSSQAEAILFHQRLQDMKSHKDGPRLLKVSNSVKVFASFSGDGAYAVSSGLVTSRVESAFRRQGFKVLTRESEEAPYSVVRVRGNMLNTDISGTSIVSGSYEVSIQQFVTYFNPFNDMSDRLMPIKSEEVTLYEYSGAFIYGRTNFRSIPEVFEKAAEQAANALRKAYDN
jgi:hypothetical protein